MHCIFFFLSVTFLAIGALCSDWDVFQDYGLETPTEPASGNLVMNDIPAQNPSIFSDSGAPDTLINLDDSSTTLNLGGIPNLASSDNLFDSGEPYTSFDEENHLDLLASADDVCSLPPARRVRARDSGQSCAPKLNIEAGDLSLDILKEDDPLGSTYKGRKITTYENADERMMGQASCPSHQIMLPGLIIPVCSSPFPGFTQGILGGALYTLYYGFMSKVFSPLLFPSGSLETKYPLREPPV